MIEKIMKAVKSGNKKRGRNITIGAVVGMLVSCTAVMGADNYLWIKNDSGDIKFNTAVTATRDGSDGNWNEANPYNQNEWNGNTYTNNMALSSGAIKNGKNENDFEIGYGLRLSGDLNGKNFINNGSIIGTSNATFGYGIYKNDGTIETLLNNGSIVEMGNTAASSYGIFDEGSIGSLINNGSIIGGNSGIITQGSIGTLTNNGSIIGMKTLGITWKYNNSNK